MKTIYMLGSTRNVRQISDILFTFYYNEVTYTGAPKELRSERALRSIKRWLYIERPEWIPFECDEQQARLGREAAGDSIRKEIEDLARQVKNETEDYAS